MSSISKYKISGMHCASCAVIIEQELKKQEGVASAEVNIATDIATIAHNTETKINIEEINENLTKLGYSLKSISTEHKSTEDSDGKHKKHEASHEHYISKNILYSSVAVTIITIFLMLYGFFGSPSEVTREFIHHLFPLLALFMLAVPGSRYIDALYRYIKYGHANMDTLIGIGTVSAFLYSFIITAFEESLAPFVDVSAHYYDTTIIIIGFITLGKYLETLTKNKTKKALEDLINLQVKTAYIKDGDNYKEIGIGDIKKDNIILVKAGAKIPVDGSIISASTYIDESAITGESLPALKKQGDKVFAGTINTSTPFEFRAEKIGEETLLSQIIKMVEDAQNSKAPIQKIADKISAVFVPTVLIIAFVTLLSWLTIGYFYNIENYIAIALSSFISILIIACPCALGLATPVALITGIGKAARNGILIKNASALELLHSADTMVIDKTGTLTEGKPSISKIVTVDDVEENIALKYLASLETLSDHPLALAITQTARQKNIITEKVEDPQNIEGMGIMGKISGKQYFAGNRNFLSENSIRISEDLNQKISGVTGSMVYLAQDKYCIAIFIIEDALRPEAKNSIQKLQNMGIDVIMATGDNEATASHTANEIGIKNWKSHVLPQDKLNLVKDLQAKNKKVIMVGDGINDAPALAQADVSIAMSSGTDVAINTSDVTLLHGDISKIEKSLETSRSTITTIKQNLFWAFSYNIIGVPLASGLLYPIFGLKLNPEFAAIAMAFSSIAVVLNALRLRK